MRSKLISSRTAPLSPSGPISSIRRRRGKLTDNSRLAFANVRPVLLERGEAGFVRRCHGDLHLRNIVLIDGEPTLFDAVEFSDEIASGDVLYDLAFLLMDLEERGLRAAANRLFNRYLALRAAGRFDRPCARCRCS